MKDIFVSRNAPFHFKAYSVWLMVLWSITLIVYTSQKHLGADSKALTPVMVIILMLTFHYGSIMFKNRYPLALAVFFIFSFLFNGLSFCGYLIGDPFLLILRNAFKWASTITLIGMFIVALFVLPGKLRKKEREYEEKMGAIVQDRLENDSSKKFGKKHPILSFVVEAILEILEDVFFWWI